MHHRMGDCHLEIYAMCQEGAEKIEELQIDFDDGKNNELHTIILCVLYLKHRVLQEIVFILMTKWSASGH